MKRTVRVRIVWITVLMLVVCLAAVASPMHPVIYALFASRTSDVLITGVLLLGLALMVAL